MCLTAVLRAIDARSGGVPREASGSMFYSRGGGFPHTQGGCRGLIALSQPRDAQELPSSPHEHE